MKRLLNKVFILILLLFPIGTVLSSIPGWNVFNKVLYAFLILILVAKYTHIKFTTRNTMIFALLIIVYFYDIVVTDWPLINSQQQRDRTITLKATVGEMIDLLGEENVRETIQQKTAAAAYKPEYKNSVGNIAGNWAVLCLFILGFAMLATIVLEMIDKDKR